MADDKDIEMKTVDDKEEEEEEEHEEIVKKDTTPKTTTTTTSTNTKQNKDDDDDDESSDDDEAEAEADDEEVEDEDEDGDEDGDSKKKDKKDTKSSSSTSTTTTRKPRSSATQLPIARVRRIMKSDKDVKIISADALFLVTKSTEMFLEYLVKEAYKKTTHDSRKILSYKDLATTVKDVDSLEFLDDIIPEKVTAT